MGRFQSWAPAPKPDIGNDESPPRRTGAGLVAEPEGSTLDMGILQGQPNLAPDDATTAALSA